MNALKSLIKCAAGILVLAGWLAGSSAAQAQQPRQYYAKSWQKQGGYYYKNYYYKPAPNAGYRYHRVIYYPSSPRYYYYYNPYSKKYWGRYDRVACGYSKLAPDAQKGMLSEIDDGAFPDPGEMPAMPESNDGTKMAEPDDGLPPDESKELSKNKVKDLMGKKGEMQLPRQVYSDWCKSGGYYYCNLICQPKAGGDYTCHRCIYYPSQPRYVYYYNPVKQKYWGRYDIQAEGYSLLADKDKAGKLSEIPEEAFPRPAEMPIIPGAADGTRIEVPPSAKDLTDE